MKFSRAQLNRAVDLARPYYQESHRFYHNWAHIEECLIQGRNFLFTGKLGISASRSRRIGLLQDWRDVGLSVAQILALAWHDAVYLPFLTKDHDVSNEGLSELLMRQVVYHQTNKHQIAAGQIDIENAAVMIRATQYHLKSTDEMYGLLAQEHPSIVQSNYFRWTELLEVMDIDLMRFADSYHSVWKHGKDIRKEFNLVPDSAFKAGRLEVLKAFLAKAKAGTLYRTKNLNHKLVTAEMKAQLNLEKEIGTLEALE